LELPQKLSSPTLCGGILRTCRTPSPFAEPPRLKPEPMTARTFETQLGMRIDVRIRKAFTTFGARDSPYLADPDLSPLAEAFRAPIAHIDRERRCTPDMAHSASEAKLGNTTEVGWRETFAATFSYVGVQSRKVRTGALRRVLAHACVFNLVSNPARAVSLGTTQSVGYISRSTDHP